MLNECKFEHTSDAESREKLEILEIQYHVGLLGILPIKDTVRYRNIYGLVLRIY